MPKFTNAAYDFLKPIALIWLPAAATLYAALAAILGLGDVTAVVGSISAIDGFLGAALHLSSSPASASDGEITIDKTNPAKDVYALNLSTSLDDLDQKESIVLKVVPKT